MDNDAFVSIRDMQWEQPKPVIFVHGDVDGMVTACIFLRARGGDAELRFTGARRIAGDLQALAERIQGGLQVSEVLIGNVPVRPPAVGAVRQLLATDISVTWVDHHNTRQPLLDEIAAFEGVNFLHDAEEAHPSHLAARVLELEDPHIDRLIQIPEGAESDDDWVQSCHTLFEKAPALFSGKVDAELRHCLLVVWWQFGQPVPYGGRDGRAANLGQGLHQLDCVYRHDARHSGYQDPCQEHRPSESRWPD